jgi:hypothetical protein
LGSRVPGKKLIQLHHGRVGGTVITLHAWTREVTALWTVGGAAWAAATPLEASPAAMIATPTSRMSLDFMIATFTRRVPLGRVYAECSINGGSNDMLNIP